MFYFSFFLNYTVSALKFTLLGANFQSAIKRYHNRKKAVLSMKIKTTNIAECELESKNFPGVKGFSKSAEGLSLNSQHKKDLIFVHLATFLFGASGLLPNFVSLHSIIISMVRGLFSVIFIFILLFVFFWLFYQHLSYLIIIRYI